MSGNAAQSARVWLTTLAALLTFCGLWQIAAETMRPALAYFPKSLVEAKVFADATDEAGFAATIGWPRGDLSVQNLVTSYSGTVSRPQASAETASIKSAAQSAANLAPYDARPWLISAALEADAARARQLLKMSYYTASANPALFPLRFHLAAQQPVDDELRTLLEFEISVLLQDVSFAPELEAIYRSTSGSSRTFLEALLTAANPAFLANLKRRGV